jgi:hypothetical protein
MLRWGFRGTWKAASDRCIRLAPDLGEPCASDSEDSCCVFPEQCIPNASSAFTLCTGGATALWYEPEHLRFEWVHGQPATPSHFDDVYGYKIDGPCTLENGVARCECAGTRDLAWIGRERRAIDTLVFIAREPLDLRMLEHSRIATLILHDPSLTSLDGLPVLPALRNLTVVAPLRTLGQLRRFPSLRELSVHDTHLTRLDGLSRLPLESLVVSSHHPLDLAPLASLRHLTTLRVGAMGITSITAANELPALVELGLFGAPRWPEMKARIDLTGLTSATLQRLALEAETPSELASLLPVDVKHQLPGLASLEVSGASYISDGTASGPGLESPNDYAPPEGVELSPLGDSARPPRGPDVCRLLAAPSLNTCGWSRGCSTHGRCSAGPRGCAARDDADCRQSRACYRDGRCVARDGACVIR